ncbi:hypothetical protein DEO72_LG2g1589 [Vigna unguiculata]|uniref:Uncharacterized protein n=1 Tax=Vigna unguiculata TaxID=3917 RepID=A0A4D6L0R1_VIGUN|nr:hypothetical protein DEO72_LG2g1589 [Vigna unguiculata]
MKLHIHQGVRLSLPKSQFQVLILTSKQSSEFEKAEGEERFEDSEARAKEDIDNVMPPESDARNYSGHGPSPDGRDENINGEGLVSPEPAIHEEGHSRMVEIGEERGAGEGDDGSDEADPGRVTAREGEVIDGDDGVVLGVVGVGGAGSADEEFDEGDEKEVNKGAQEKRKE